LEGIGIGPVTQFVPSKLDLRDLHLYSSYDYEVQLQNLGDMEVSEFCWQHKRMEPITISWRVFLGKKTRVFLGLVCLFGEVGMWLHEFCKFDSNCIINDHLFIYLYINRRAIIRKGFDI
jgi:hypothetical protein